MLGQRIARGVKGLLLALLGSGAVDVGFPLQGCRADFARSSDCVDFEAMQSQLSEASGCPWAKCGSVSAFSPLAVVQLRIQMRKSVFKKLFSKGIVRVTVFRGFNSRVLAFRN